MKRNDFPAVYDMTMEEIEDRLQEIQRNYKEFFEEARDGFYISTREGQFIDCNQTLVAMLGYACEEEVLALDLNTDVWENPQDRKAFQKIIEQQGFVKEYEATFKRQDQSTILVTLSSRVWRDRHGTIRGYRGFVVDHAVERMIRDQLAASEARYRHLFESIQDGLFISDSSGTVVDCNPALCAILGYSREEFMSMDYYKDLFVDPSEALRFRRLLTNTGLVRDYELQIRRKDGAVRDVSMSGYASRNSKGSAVLYEGLVRDITETNRLQKQLIRSERLSAMGKMASQLAHELNNPIYGIMNCLELVKEAVPENHARRKYLDLAHQECQRTSELLVKMLKYFKPDNEQRSTTQVNSLLQETLLFYEKQFLDLGIEVRTNLQHDLPPIHAVANQLKQVFINMVLNANAAMPSGGTLLVSSRHDPNRDQILIEFEDTGTGIEPEHLDKIFEAFFTTKKDVKGSGLGLSVCHNFIAEHGGRIETQSEVGKGTKFTLFLPLHTAETDQE
jgi:two-component system NtrC family sensor kinase